MKKIEIARFRGHPFMYYMYALRREPVHIASSHGNAVLVDAEIYNMMVKAMEKTGYITAGMSIDNDYSLTDRNGGEI